MDVLTIINDTRLWIGQLHWKYTSVTHETPWRRCRWCDSQFTFAQWPPCGGDVTTRTIKCPFCCFYYQSLYITSRLQMLNLFSFPSRCRFFFSHYLCHLPSIFLCFFFLHISSAYMAAHFFFCVALRKPPLPNIRFSVILKKCFLVYFFFRVSFRFVVHSFSFGEI